MTDIVQSSSGTLRTHAILSLGAVLSRTVDKSLAVKIRSLLSYVLETANESQNPHEIITALNAIGNAGPQFASLEETWNKVGKLLRLHGTYFHSQEINIFQTFVMLVVCTYLLIIYFSSDENIQSTVFHSIRKFPIVDVVKLFSQHGLLSRENALRFLATNYHTDSELVFGSDFPYNK